MQSPNILRTAIFAAVASAAAVGFWFLFAQHTRIFSPLLAIPATAILMTAGLIALDRYAEHRGYRAGVANAQTDLSTRLPATATARQILALEFAAAERGNRPLTIALISMDNFRRLAVMEGGTARERLLVAAGAIFRRRTRGMNISARLDDGGLFISVLGGVEVSGARIFVNRVRKDLGTLSVGTTGVTVSASLCAYEPGMASPDELMAKAQDALASVRAKGANALVVAGELDYGNDAQLGYAVI
jgi:diguanylate cyclase (GGDEF)-like protein